MCLDVGTIKVYNPPIQGLETGWKVFRASDTYIGRFHNLYCGNDVYTHGVWYTATSNGFIRVVDGAFLIYPDTRPETCYPTGFHIFLHPASAKKYAYRRGYGSSRYILAVEFNEMLAQGTQDGEPCIVARKMQLIINKEEKACV